MGNIKRAGDLVSALFKDEFDPASLEKGRLTAGVFNSWAEISEEAEIPAAAAHSRIRELERGVLVIEAEHPGWVQLLQTRQNQLLRLVCKKFPELTIQGISFCLSREPLSSPGKEAPGQTDLQPGLQSGLQPGLQSGESGAGQIAAAAPDDNPSHSPRESPGPRPGPDLNKKTMHESLDKLKRSVQNRYSSK